MKQYIDCHNHSLPFIDDGAKDMDMALKMLAVSYEDGVREVCLTPHHLNGVFMNKKMELLKPFIELKNVASKHFPDLALHLGSEVHLVDRTADEVIKDIAITYADKGKAVLIELPTMSIPLGIESALQKMLDAGVTPIIAHPERNASLRNDLTPLQSWIAMGCKSQLTAMSCEGKFGPDILKTSFKMIRAGLVHLVASDAHRPEGRSPVLSSSATAIEKEFGIELASLFFYDNPRRLLKGEELITCNVTSFKKKKRFFFF